ADQPTALPRQRHVPRRNAPVGGALGCGTVQTQFARRGQSGFRDRRACTQRPSAEGGGIGQAAPVPESFEDHFSQARMFWLSLSETERQHLADAFVFELGKCYEETIRKRQLRVLAAVDPELCAEVAQGLGLDPPQDSAPAEVAP